MRDSNTSYFDRVEALRDRLSHRGLWLDGREPGRPDPAGFDNADLRLLICRLSPYADVQASITHRLLMCAAQAVPGVYTDLAFFPSAHDAPILQEAGIPFWLATGARRAPRDFDVVAISISVPQESFNLPAALHDSGLLTAYSDRMRDECHPLILLGGHAAGSAPFLHGDVTGLPECGGLVDAVCLGDGVAWLQEFLARSIQARRSGQSKPDFLSDLAGRLPGSYIPALYRHRYDGVKLIAVQPSAGDLPYPVSGRAETMDTWWQVYDGGYIPLSEEEEEETLPLSAGCIYRCRFCQTGWLREKLTSASAGIESVALRLKRNLVPSDLNLLASDACSVPALEPVLRSLTPLFRHVSLKSLSLSSVVRHPELLHLVQSLSKHEFTFGIEGVSARLRAYLGKPARLEAFPEIVRRLADAGLRQLKLFFIATGLEEPSDLDEFALLIKRLRAQAPGARLIASFMPLFHAPFTPLQFAPFQTWNARVERILQSLVAAAGGEFRWSAPPEEIRLMNRLCRAGRRATATLVDFSIRHKLRYYDGLNSRACREFEEVLDVKEDRQSLKTVLPWDDLQPASSKATLWRAYQRALKDLRAEASEEGSLRPLPPLRKQEQPPPPPLWTRHVFWGWAGIARARQPDQVVARSLLRSLFKQWPEGCAAYLGQPAIRRPPSAAGLILVAGTFRAECTPPPVLQTLPPDRVGRDVLLSGPVDPALWTQPDILFMVQWPGQEAAGQFQEAWKAGQIKFQTLRQNETRWHILGPAFRTRTGITALRERDSYTELFCAGVSQPAIKTQAFRHPVDGLAVAVWSRTSCCPKCGNSAYTAMPSIASTDEIVCLDCLLNPK